MRSAETLADLQKFLTLLDPSLSLDAMLTNVARQLVEMFDVDHSGVLFFGSEDLEGEVLAEYPSQGMIGLKVPLTDYPLADQLKREQKAIAVLDAQNDPVMGNARPTMRTLGIQSILIVPLILRSRLVGSFSLDSIQARREFMPDELHLCSVIGNQIAVAIDYTRALEAAEANHRQAQTLREVNRVLSESLNLDEILPRILDQLEKVVPADASSIFLLVETGVQLVATRSKYNQFKEKEIVPLNELWGASEIIKSKKPLLVSHTHEHDQWKVYEGSPLRSWLGVPLLVRGEAVGVLNIDGYSPHQFNETHIYLAQAFANQAAIAIYNARLYGQAQKRAEMLASVQEIGLSMVASLELEEVLREVTTSVLHLFEAGQVRIYLYQPEEDSFTLAAVTDNEGQLNIRATLPRKDGLTATVARSGRYLAIPDIACHPLYEGEVDIHGFRAIIGVPLEKRHKVLGVLNVFYAQPHYFSDDEINMLHLLATQAAVALENARLYQLEVKQVEQELSIARQIQQGLFPRRVPEIPGWQIAAVCLPARETGGDFFDFVKRADGRLGVVIGDVSGKGISAAILMAASQSVVSAKGTDHLSPARVITETNHLLCDDVLPESSFIALSYVLLTPDSGTIYLSNGGQLAPFLMPAEDRPIYLVETPGNHLPIGIVAEVTYQEVTLNLPPGATLVFHTDGIVERKNEAGELFGFERLAAVLKGLHGAPPETILDTILKASDEFAHGIGQADDATLVIVQRQPAP
jgi:serine phosphatase RsbU (regulator of sigma subunit)/uncharacterized protein YigA (DUF484 family)